MATEIRSISIVNSALITTKIYNITIEYIYINNNCVNVFNNK